MNPNIDRNALMAIDHRDFERQSGLDLNYFTPRNRNGEWLIVCAIVATVAALVLYYGGWIA